MAPNFSKLVSKNLETSFRAKICTNSPKICANSPKICTNSPKICTNFPKIILKNVVTRFLNNFRIYGTPPSPGVYNDTNFLASGKIRHFEAISVKTRQNQAPTSCLNRVFISSTMSQSCAFPISMPQGEIEFKSPKKMMNPYGIGFMRTLTLAVRSSWVTLLPTALGLNPTG